jgi:hypothetical protein
MYKILRTLEELGAFKPVSRIISYAAVLLGLRTFVFALRAYEGVSKSFRTES